MPYVALDATAEALARRVLADVPADRPRGAADVDRLPAPLVPLLHARLAAAVEAAAPMPTPWLDAEPVRQAAAAWQAAAAAAVAFPADEWDRAVHETASLALAHLVRPAETLAAVAFVGAPPRLPMSDALDRARVFGPYPYLPQIAARYAERKGLETIDRSGLEQLLLRIDRRMVSTFGPSDWATLLGPLLTLVGPVGTPTGSAPTSLLQAMFMTKGAGALAVELEGIDSLSPDELRVLLSRALRKTPDATGASPDAEPGLTDVETDDPDRTVAATSPAVAQSPATPPDDDVRPPTIGSKYLAPEYDGDDASAVLGPPRPLGSTHADDTPDEAPADDTPDEAFQPDPDRPDPGATAPEPADDLLPHDAPTDDDPTGDAWAGDAWAGDASMADDPPADDAAVEDASPEADPSPPDAWMHEIREAVATPTPTEPDDAPPVPVLDLSPALPSPGPEASEPDDDDWGPTVWASFSDDDDVPPPSGDSPADAVEPSALAQDDGSPSGDEPLWRRLAREQSEADEATAAPPPPPEEEEPLWKRFAQSDLAARLPEPPERPATESPALDALEARVLGPSAEGRREWFVDELFDGSEDAYRQTLDRIGQAATYTEATGIVSSDVFRAHRVNPYTESAVAFIDAIQSQFGA